MTGRGTNARPDETVISTPSGLAASQGPNAAAVRIVPSRFVVTIDSATKAAVHSFTQSLRVQWAATPLQVVELVPPAVQTTLMGQQDDESAMPLDEFLDETVRILEQQPDVEEVLVQRVRFLRDAEAEGRHADVLALLSQRH